MWYAVAIHAGYALSRDPDQFHPLSFSEARELCSVLNKTDEWRALQATMAAIGWMTVTVGPVVTALHLWGVF